MGKTPVRWQTGRLSSAGDAARVPHGRRWRRPGFLLTGPSTPNGILEPWATAVKGRGPGPLDDGGQVRPQG